MSIRYASVCDGIGAAHVAARGLGWECAWTSEIEPFPIAVVEHHFGFPNLGDMLAITETDLERYGRIDLLVGGTPCQSFSVAGLRKGLADPRGNLAIRFLQLAGAARPRWLVWENVPGVLSSGGGRDFGAILGGLGELGYGWAYRVLDAQYVRVDGHERAVPQCRRRVFVVGYLGDWRRAAAVLFERASLCGHPPPGREAGSGVATCLTRGLGSGGANAAHAHAGWMIPEVANPLTARMHKGVNTTCDEGQTMVAHALRAEGFDASEDGTGRGTPIVPVDLRNALRDADKRDEMNRQGCGIGLAFGLQARHGNIGQAHNTTYIPEGGVRRLTPRECERLQGFPDDYTLVTFRGKPAADGPRYRALGNSMAVNVMRWLWRRIEMVEDVP